MPADPGATPQEEQPTPAATETDASEAASAMLNVQVPENATIVINDHVTKSTGEARRYVSRGLTPGLSYEYTVRATLNRGGATNVRTKVVQLKAGQSVDLAFDFDVPQVASR
jgi:uncharacterized protein (TIGR03000 family)